VESEIGRSDKTDIDRVTWRDIMKTKYISASAATLLLGLSAAQAAPIDLAGLGLTEGTPVYAGTGGVFYDDNDSTVADDFGFNPFVLDDFADSEVVLEFDGLGLGFGDIVEVSYEFLGDYEYFDIVAFGDNGSDTFEFLLQLSDSDLSFGTTDLGDDAIMRITSGDFDFSNGSPFDFFAANADANAEFFADVSFTLTALDGTLTSPLPATLPLVLAGMGGLAWAGRRKS
jgi:hypothetical protein